MAQNKLAVASFVVSVAGVLIGLSNTYYTREWAESGGPARARDTVLAHLDPEYSGRDPGIRTAPNGFDGSTGATADDGQTGGGGMSGARPGSTTDTSGSTTDISGGGADTSGGGTDTSGSGSDGRGHIDGGTAGGGQTDGGTAGGQINGGHTRGVSPGYHPRASDPGSKAPPSERG